MESLQVSEPYPATYSRLIKYVVHIHVYIEIRIYFFNLPCVGFGFGMAYIPSISIIGHYFVKRRSLAFGLSVSGCGFGTFIFPPLIRHFVDTYGWRSSLMLTGAVCLHLCVFGALMRDPSEKEPPPPIQTKQLVCESEKENLDVKQSREQQITKKRKTSFNLFIFKNIDYLVLCVNNVLFSFGWSVIYVHLGTYSETIGCSKQQAAMLFSVIGATNLIGRILYGLLGQSKCFSAMMWYIQGLLCCGIATTLSPLSTSYVGLVVFAAFFGLFSASVGPLLPYIQVEFLGVALLANAYGYLFVFEAIGQLMGAPVAGTFIMTKCL